MRIVLIRHAQCEWQLTRCGTLDSRLTSLGVRQAELLADWLASQPFEVGFLCASRMLRARQTLEPVAARLELPIAASDMLAEADFSVSEELPTTDGPFSRTRDYVLSARYLSWKRTAAAALDQLATWAHNRPSHLIAVSHGGLIKTILRVAMNSDVIDFQIYNTGLTRLEWHKGRWQLSGLNQMDHLPIEFRTL